MIATAKPDIVVRIGRYRYAVTPSGSVYRLVDRDGKRPQRVCATVPEVMAVKVRLGL